MRVGAVDIGTNTVRLLVADLTAAGLDEVVRRSTVTRLGQDVDRTGRFHPDAIARTLAVLVEYNAVMERHGAAARRLVATSATRDVAAAASFLEAVRDIAGVAPEVIAGAEEGRLSFHGAMLRRSGIEPGPVLVIDVGGGSTEFVVGDEAPAYTASIDIGSVRLTERLLNPGPLPAAAIAAARAHTAELFGKGVQLPGVGSVIGVGGTYTTLAAAQLGLEVYDRTVVEGSSLSAGQLAELVEWLGGMSLEEIQAIPSMEPGRAPVVLGGAIVAEQALATAAAAELTVSESDILDGIALSIGAAP